MLNVNGGIRMTHVPYKGAGPALLDVIAGQVQLIITSPIAAGPHIRNGKVRALATTGAERNPALPTCRQSPKPCPVMRSPSGGACRRRRKPRARS